MAGAGYKLFNTGDVLTAAQVNTYLNEQTVMVFADSAARTTALTGVLAEGMMSYLQDTNAVEVYNGSSWVGVGGGLTSPLTTKGDIWVYGTGDTRLPVGTNGHTLVADSVEATGLKWVAPAGGGKVLQVVQGTLTTNITSSSSTLVDTGLTQAITPSSATSKILCLVNVDGVAKNAQNAGNAVKFSVLRGATEIAATYHTGYTNSTLVNVVGSWSSIILDSPATTSATTYKVQYANNNNGASVEINYFGNTSTITLMEIGA